MSSSDLSELTSSLSTDDDLIVPYAKGTLEHYFKGKNGPNAIPSSPPVKKKRPPSPLHEYVLADNPAIAVRLVLSSHYVRSKRACWIGRI